MRKNLFLVLIFFVFICIFSSAIYIFAEIPHLINYQGRLTDTGGVPLNGSYNLTFRIYDAETAGNLLWEETQTGVVINKGIFAVLLGSVTNLNLAFDKPYFLEIKVGNEVMSPRQTITSAAYAMAAENGTPKGGIIMWSGSTADIPSGWLLCDGTNSTPDLRNRFIVGAGASYAAGAVGGEATHVLTIAEMPAHTHLEQGVHQHGSGEGPAEAIWSQEYKQSGSSGGGQAHNNLPPYYALCYIMKN